MGIEIQLLDSLQKIHTPVLNRVMCLITHLGDSGMIWILLALVLLVMKRTRKTGAILAVALIVDLILCNGILKNLVARARPFTVNPQIALLIPTPHDFSFPSGHTAAAFTAVTALYLGKARALFKPALVLAILIAFSRLYLYVHYPTDILGGIVCGVLCGYAGYRLVKFAWR